MVRPVYSIRDLKVGFMDPICDHNDASAVRNFEHAIRNKDSLFYTHAEDFALYKIGTFDNDTGRVMLLDVPEMICSAFDVKDR